MIYQKQYQYTKKDTSRFGDSIQFHSLLPEWSLASNILHTLLHHFSESGLHEILFRWTYSNNIACNTHSGDTWILHIQWPLEMSTWHILQPWVNYPLFWQHASNKYERPVDLHQPDEICRRWYFHLMNYNAQQQDKHWKTNAHQKFQLYWFDTSVPTHTSVSICHHRLLFWILHHLEFVQNSYQAVFLHTGSRVLHHLRYQNQSMCNNSATQYKTVSYTAFYAHVVMHGLSGNINGSIDWLLQAEA